MHSTFSDGNQGLLDNKLLGNQNLKQEILFNLKLKNILYVYDRQIISFLFLILITKYTE